MYSGGTIVCHFCLVGVVTNQKIQKRFVIVHIKVQLEMLQMDLEDNETVVNTCESQVEELKGTIESLEAQLTHNNTQMTDMEARLEDSQAQVESQLHSNLSKSFCATDCRLTVEITFHHLELKRRFHTSTFPV